MYYAVTLLRRINRIIRLVIFARGGHGGDFGFRAGASAFLSGVANRA